MVVGLDRFKAHFAPFKERMVVIGGTALYLAMEAEGLQPRATKDIDIVLVLEAVDKTFAAAFWQFVRDGGYETWRAEGEAKKVDYYRFSRPEKPDYPYMIEFFSRKPGVIDEPAGMKFRAIDDGEDLSFSMMLLDDDYYGFLMANSIEDDGIVRADVPALIALKTYAWTELVKAKAAGAKDATNDRINKHGNDVLRLQGLVPNGSVFPCPVKVAANVAAYADAYPMGKDLQQLKISQSAGEISTRLKAMFPAS